MSQAPRTPWWTERQPTEEPRGRWLGFISRTLRLRPDQPQRVPEAAPRPGESAPHCLTVPVEAMRGCPDRLSTVRPVPTARTLAVRFDPAIHSAGGCVGLAERLLSKDRVEPWTGPTSAAEEPWLEQQPAEVPLWKRLSYLLQLPTHLLLQGQGPIAWPGALFPYQIEGIRALICRESLLLADDMGLGKTVQVIAALRILVHQRRAESALVVVPASLTGEWQRALRLWAPELRVSTIRGPAAERAWQWSAPAHVYLVSYETLREDFTANRQSPPRRRVWDVVILDEAQKIKNPEAEISRKCKLLQRRRAWAMTGTPLENSLDDLASILEFVQPYRDGERPLRLYPGPALTRQQRAVQLRRRKGDVLPQLPPKLSSQIVLPLAGTQRESYERAELDGVFQLRERGERVRIENVLELITRLKQLCNFCPTSGSLPSWKTWASAWPRWSPKGIARWSSPSSPTRPTTPAPSPPACRACARCSTPGRSRWSGAKPSSAASRSIRSTRS